MSQLLNKKTLGLLMASAVSLPTMAAEQVEGASTGILDNPLNTLLLISASALFILLLALGYIINKVISTKDLWINKKFLGILLIGFFSSYAGPVSAATEQTAEVSMVDGTT